MRLSTLHIGGPGRIDVSFNYKLKKECKKWELEGTFMAEDNVFDFNKRPYGERDKNTNWFYWKEWSTRIGACLPGESFTVKFHPYKIKISGECQ